MNNGCRCRLATMTVQEYAVPLNTQKFSGKSDFYSTGPWQGSIWWTNNFFVFDSTSQKFFKLKVPHPMFPPCVHVDTILDRVEGWCSQWRAWAHSEDACPCTKVHSNHTTVKIFGVNKFHDYFQTQIHNNIDNRHERLKDLLTAVFRDFFQLECA